MRDNREAVASALARIEHRVFPAYLDKPGLLENLGAIAARHDVAAALRARAIASWNHFDPILFDAGVSAIMRGKRVLAATEARELLPIVRLMVGFARALGTSVNPCAFDSEGLGAMFVFPLRSTPKARQR